MKLRRAIQLLTSDQENILISSVAELRQAKKLSIEALEAVLAWHNDDDDALLWALVEKTEELKEGK